MFRAAPKGLDKAGAVEANHARRGCYHCQRIGTMNKKEAVKLWVREHKPAIVKQEAGNKDIPLRYESWRVLCEGLATLGQITESQRHRWRMPREVER